MAPSIEPAFIAQSRRYLAGEYLPKIMRCVARLTDEDLWWRPHEGCNSVGNLLLHLAGNVRQWIVSGIGGAPDQRDRQAEFDQRAPVSREELLHRLETAIQEVDAVLAALDPRILAQERTIQGHQETVLGAIYHVVEHFATHVGQITWITKMRTGEDLGFYRVRDGVADPTW